MTAENPQTTPATIPELQQTHEYLSRQEADPDEILDTEDLNSFINTAREEISQMEKNGLLSPSYAQKLAEDIQKLEQQLHDHDTNEETPNAIAETVLREELTAIEQEISGLSLYLLNSEDAETQLAAVAAILNESAVNEIALESPEKLTRDIMAAKELSSEETVRAAILVRAQRLLQYQRLEGVKALVINRDVGTIVLMFDNGELQKYTDISVPLSQDSALDSNSETNEENSPEQAEPPAEAAAEELTPAKELENILKLHGRRIDVPMNGKGGTDISSEVLLALAPFVDESRLPILRGEVEGQVQAALDTFKGNPARAFVVVDQGKILIVSEGQHFDKQQAAEAEKMKASLLNALRKNPPESPENIYAILAEFHNNGVSQLRNKYAFSKDEEGSITISSWEEGYKPAAYGRPEDSLKNEYKILGIGEEYFPRIVEALASKVPNGETWYLALNAKIEANKQTAHIVSELFANQNSAQRNHLLLQDSIDKGFSNPPWGIILKMLQGLFPVEAWIKNSTILQYIMGIKPQGSLDPLGTEVRQEILQKQGLSEKLQKPFTVIDWSQVESDAEKWFTPSARQQFELQKEKADPNAQAIIRHILGRFQFGGEVQISNLNLEGNTITVKAASAENYTGMVEYLPTGSLFGGTNLTSDTFKEELSNFTSKIQSSPISASGMLLGGNMPQENKAYKERKGETTNFPPNVSIEPVGNMELQIHWWGGNVAEKIKEAKDSLKKKKD